MSVLAIASGDLENCRKLIGAATKIDGELHLCLLGKWNNEQVQHIACIDGITKVLHINPSVQLDTAELQADVVVQIAQPYQHIIALADTYGKNCMPRIAALCDITMVSDIIDVVSESVFIRPMYAGNVIAEVEVNGPTCLTIRAAAFAASNDGDTIAPIETIILPTTEAAKATQIVERRLTVSDRPDLASAKVIVSGGRGLGSKEAFETLITPLANALNAGIGATRAAVDSGYVPNDYQVGQTGKIVAPDVYIAIGISGAIQHIAGIQNAKIIVAINKDEEAPIFSIADYGLIGDLFTLIPELTKKLTQ